MAGSRCQSGSALSGVFHHGQLAGTRSKLSHLKGGGLQASLLSLTQSTPSKNKVERAELIREMRPPKLEKKKNHVSGSWFRFSVCSACHWSGHAGPPALSTFVYPRWCRISFAFCARPPPFQWRIKVLCLGMWSMFGSVFVFVSKTALIACWITSGCGQGLRSTSSALFLSARRTSWADATTLDISLEESRHKA